MKNIATTAVNVVFWTFILSVLSVVSAVAVKFLYTA